MTNKRQLVFDALNNKATERVPVGFWFHYTENEMLSVYEGNSKMRQQNIDGHKKFVKEFQPDFVKLMSDGYFFEPKTKNILASANTANDLYNLTVIADNDPWIEDQVSLVKELTSSFGKDIFTVYNIFAPATAFKWSINGGEKKLVQFLKEDKFAVIHALSVIAQNTEKVARRVVTEGGTDGIYLSVQSIQDSFVGPDLYAEVIAPTEISVLNAANSVSQNNLLHICGYEGARNNLNNFKNYPVKAINFASVVEGVSLEEGKRIFKGKTVIGGFANLKDSVLSSGTKEEVQKETKRLIEKAGRTGIILGADCTIPRDINFERLEWVREAAK